MSGQQKLESYLGDPTVLDFMQTRLVHPLRHHDVVHCSSLFPMKNSLMLFGKNGAGKRTLIETYYKEFEHVDGFVLQEYNMGDFCEWCDKISASLAASGNQKRLVLVENVHLMAYCKGTAPEQQMQKLMAHTRSRSRIHNEPVFLVTTCGEGPLRINDTLVRLVDYMCYVPPPSDEQRLSLFKRFIDGWLKAVQNIPIYSKMEVELEDEDFRLLSLVSKNTVPGDIWNYCQRCFDAVPYPDTKSVFSGELLQAMMYSTNAGKSIIQGVPEEELRMFAMYIDGPNSHKRGPPEEGSNAPSAAEALASRGRRMAKKQKSQEQEGDVTIGTPEWPPVENSQAWIREEGEGEGEDGDGRKRSRDIPGAEDGWAEFEREYKKRV